MRVLMLGLGHQRDVPGGANRYMTQLADELAQRGHEIHCLVGDCTDRLPAREQIGRVTVHRFVASGGFFGVLWNGWKAAWQLARTESFDLVNSHFAFYAAGARLVPALARLPWETTFHGPWADESAVEDPRASCIGIWVKGRIEAWIYRRSHRCDTKSRAFAEILIGRYAIDRSCVEVIPAFLDTRESVPAVDPAVCRSRLGLSGAVPLWISVRRLTRRMGLDRLIRVFGELIRQGFAGHLVIVGAGDQRPDLETLIQALGATDRIRLAGLVSEETLADYYGAADLHIVPTIALEGFGLIAIESLARGLPVLATPVGGLVEVLAPLDPACLTADASDAALLAALQEAIDGRRRLPAATRCRDHAVERYDAEVVVPRVEALFRQVIEARSSAGRSSLATRQGGGGRVRD